MDHRSLRHIPERDPGKGIGARSIIGHHREVAWLELGISKRERAENKKD